jgi:SAM-dependent methyltransferase
MSFADEHTDEAGHFELSSLDWLLLHHRVKRDFRRALVRSLDIRPGDRVLDLGCGPGLWSGLLAEAVGPSGHVVGVDLDAVHLNFARTTVRPAAATEIEFRRLAFQDLDYPPGAFDVVFFSNCLCYTPEPEQILSIAKSLTAPGGRVIGRNWDDGAFIVHPVPVTLHSRIECALAEAMSARGGDSYLDNYFGRKLPGLFRQNGFSDVTCQTSVFERSGQVDDDLVAYIRANVNWMSETISGVVDAALLDEWRDNFFRSDGTSVFDSEEFYFGMVEMTVTAAL